MSRQVIALLTAAVWLAAGSVAPTFLHRADPRAMDTWVEQTLSSLNTEQRLAQLMMVEVTPRDNDSCRARVQRLVDMGVGGIIYSESTLPEQVGITNHAQSLARVPLLLGMDGEWGPAMRVKDTPLFARNLVLGAIDDDRLLYDYGREVARECRRLGLQLNFAPVLDVNDNPDNPVIGTRSFGQDPDVVARHAIAYAKGLEDGGVIAVGKHFPGHGATWEDSHKTLPIIDKSMMELNVCELVPFRRFVNAGLSGILTAHLQVPAIDNSPVPTTMSRRCVTGLLRRQMGFEGLIITDALGMKGATQLLDGASPCVAALKAGNDILLMPDDPAAELRALKKAVDSGEITTDEVDEHCRRVLRYKYALGLTECQRVDMRGIADDLWSDSQLALRHDLTAATVTVARNTDNVLPLGHLDKARIAVVTVGGTGTFADRCADYARVERFNIDSEADLHRVTALLKKDHFDHVLAMVGTDDDEHREWASQLAHHIDRLVLTLCATPYRLKHYATAIGHKHVKALVLTYEPGTLAEDYAAQTVFGGNATQGRLPVSVVAPDGKTLLAAGTGLLLPATRLGYGVPSQVGMDNHLLAQIDSVIAVCLDRHAIPGCQVLVARHNKVVCNRAYGVIADEDPVPVTTSTLYDLASVSKATGTLSAAMWCYDKGLFTLDEPVSKVIPDLRDGDKADITFSDVLYHETGLAPSISMWDMMMDTATYSGKLITGKPDNEHHIKIMKDAYGHDRARLRTDIMSDRRTSRFDIAIADGVWGSRETYDSIMRRIYHSPLGSKRYRYSCLNFSLLADAVQRMTHRSLDRVADSEVFGPLGAYHTMYRPLSRYSREQIAYSEVDTYLRRQHLHGYVHDELAAFSGGVQGNAGLFSNANDLAKLMQMWLNGGTYGGMTLLSPQTVEVFTTQKSPNSHRGLGFDKPVVGNPEASNTCDEATPETFGHTGFTGTCFWIDPRNDFIYIFLSNRVSPTRSNAEFSRLSPRSRINTLIYKAIKN